MADQITPFKPDREAAVARLTTAFAEDQISLEEFERRVEEVYRAATSVALAKLTADLPAPAAAQPVEPDATPVSSRISAMFRSLERASRMVVPRRLEIRATFSNVELDLTQAKFREGRTEISIRAFCSSVEIRLPAGVAVEEEGGTVFGIFAAHTAPLALEPAAHPAPTIRLAGRSIFSSVEATEVRVTPKLPPTA
jgi:hypothetical protein